MKCEWRNSRLGWLSRSINTAINVQNYLWINWCFWLTSDAFQFENTERLKQTESPWVGSLLTSSLAEPLWGQMWGLDLSVSLFTCGQLNGVGMDIIQASQPTSPMWWCVCWQGSQGWAFLTSLSAVTTACEKNWLPVGVTGAQCSGNHKACFLCFLPSFLQKRRGQAKAEVGQEKLSSLWWQTLKISLLGPVRWLSR